MTSTKTSAFAAAALLASTSYAAALGLSHGSVGLSYGKADLQGPDATTTGINGAADFNLTDKLSFGVNAKYDAFNYDAVTTVNSVTGYGADISYAIMPNASIGAYDEGLSYDLPGSSSNTTLDRYGVTGSYNLSDMATLSAYYGRYNNNDLNGDNVRAYGLRADVSLDGGIGLYASYQRDRNGSADVNWNKASIGASYSLEGMTGQPILLTADYSDYTGTLDAYHTKQFTVGASWLFGGSGKAPTGFTGDHGVLGSSPLPNTP